MTQIALPLPQRRAADAARIVVGNANCDVANALADAARWPFGTAILTGPPRSGKSLFAHWFVHEFGGHGGEMIDGADAMEETDLFHRWNRTQESGGKLLLVSDKQPWTIALPDLRSRLGAALHLEIGVPDDEMVAALIESHAAQRGLALAEGALTYLVPRLERSFAGVEALVAAIDRLSLERKVPATMSIWRDALEAVHGAEQPRLF